QGVRGCRSEIFVCVADLLGDVATAAVCQLVAATLDFIEEPLDIAVVEVEWLDELVHLGKLDAAALLAPCHQGRIRSSLSIRSHRSGLHSDGPSLPVRAEIKPLEAVLATAR